VFDLSFLTVKDIEVLDKKAGFTYEQRVILEHLQKNDLTDEGIMLELRLSRNKYYKIKENLIQKIIRTAVQS
jgi:DNA-binding transcriptional ArsR family regulator